MVHQWEHLQTAYESVHLPSAKKQKAPQQKHTHFIRQSDNQVTCSTSCPPHAFPFCPLVLQENLIFSYVAINTIMCFTQTLTHWRKSNLIQPWTIVLLKKSPLMVVMCLLLRCASKQVVSALPDLRHVFSFQSSSHSWLSGLDYLCCSWSWKFKAFDVSLASVLHWSC